MLCTCNVTLYALLVCDLLSILHCIVFYSTYTASATYSKIYG